MIKHFVFPVIVFCILVMYFLSVFKVTICHTSEGFCKSFKKVKCVSITIAGGNINEVIRTILNFFIQKFHNRKKAQNAYKQTKMKKVYKKHLSSKINEIIETIVV